MMSGKKTKLNLQYHEIILLKNLSKINKSTVLSIKDRLEMDQAAIVRAVMTLAKNGLLKLDEKEMVVASLTKQGQDVLKSGLPEKRLIEAALKEPRLDRIDVKDKNIALGWAKKKGLIKLSAKDGVPNLEVTDKGKDFLKIKTDIEKDLEKAREKKILTKEEIASLKKRRFIKTNVRTVRNIMITPLGKKVASSVKVVKQVSSLTPELIKDGKWKEVELRKYNVVAPVAKKYPAKRHFVNQTIDYVKSIWLDMGFEEMEGKLVNTSFWNFDALFTPQNHPAREMQDTFFLDVAPGDLPEGPEVAHVRQMHEEGDEKSMGWRYSWKESEARKVVLRTHTTCLSTQRLSMLKPDELPKKFFAMGKVFRNETLDWKHLFEFYQMEGIVADENANFKQLLGYLKKFYKKMGYDDIRVRPAYFPYTEMSVEIEYFHPMKKEWVELGGAGMLRPEVVKPLIGKEVPVLAWGQGLGRILTEYYDINDIRELYKNDIDMLRKTRIRI